MIELYRCGNVLGIIPWVPELAPVLTCNRVIQTREMGKVKYTTQVLPLYYPVQGDAYACPGGLLSRVMFWMDQHQIQYKLTDVQDPLPDVDLPEGVTLRPWQPEVLATIVSSRCGVINLPTAGGKTFVIELLCQMYADQKILIVTTSISVLNDIFRRVKAAAPNRKIGMIDATHKAPDNAEIIVCSSGSLHHVESDWPDLMLFDEVHHAAAPELFQALGRFDSCRMFGLSASPEDRADNSDILIEALFGPCHCKVSYQDAMEAGTIVPIQVYMLPVGGTYIDKKNDIARDRHNLWRNSLRNRTIAEAAKAFPNEQVLIMTSTVEHALFIHQLLPGFELVHGGISKERREEFVKLGVMKADDPLTVDKERIKNEMRDGKVQKAISTMTWKEGLKKPFMVVTLCRNSLNCGNISSRQSAAI